MINKLRSLFGKGSVGHSPLPNLTEGEREAAGELNWEDPATRTGASLYLVLSKQFELIGKPEGIFPYTSPFATDKARGALLGTAISIVRQQYREPQQQHIIDAAVTAFSLAYGNENGRFYALQTLRNSADGDNAVNFASDWAVRDTDGANADESPATPAAFYLAVAGMI
jgi:hypothetical protein